MKTGSRSRPSRAITMTSSKRSARNGSAAPGPRRRRHLRRAVPAAAPGASSPDTIPEKGLPSPDAAEAQSLGPGHQPRALEQVEQGGAFGPEFGERQGGGRRCAAACAAGAAAGAPNAPAAAPARSRLWCSRPRRCRPSPAPGTPGAPIGRGDDQVDLVERPFGRARAAREGELAGAAHAAHRGCPRRRPAPGARRRAERAAARAAGHHVFRPHSGQNFDPGLELGAALGALGLGQERTAAFGAELAAVVLDAAGRTDEHGGRLEVQALGEVLRAQLLARLVDGDLRLQRR